ncbi:Retrovirus-related Pol polyprotein [Stylophora pistillata]|uniref:Retrovirus-related Pol polyprotein n=1 Tax=Stylophora pistillata TaxID=50429 RepID=A0A2B4SP03_STYPI|nr:Retrovirus-related Pol polyprotein [Stylophora pistillata]
MKQTMTRAIVKFVNDNHDDWDVHLKPFLFAYRTSKHDSTKFTSFELMFDRAPVLPIEMEIRSKPSSADSLTFDKSEDEPSDFDEKVRLMMSMRNQVKAQAIQNIEKAQERQKKSYDAKHQPLKFKEGDTVLLKNIRNEARKGGKLERAWSGPYTISKVLPKSLHKLRKEDEPTKSVKVNLLGRKRDTILSRRRLDDNIINESQKLLKKQFPNIGGWQDTLLCQTSFSAVTDESVQIHLTGKNHRVCSTSINGHLRVYDGLSSKNSTSSMEVQLAECYQTLATDRTLAVELPLAQTQQGGVDSQNPRDPESTESTTNKENQKPLQELDVARFPIISSDEIHELKSVTCNKNTSRSTKQWMIMQSVIGRYIKEKNYSLSIVQSREFHSSREILNAKAISLRQQGKGKRPNKAQPITSEEESALWEKGQLGDFNGKVLTNVNSKNLTEQPGFRGRQEHYDAYVEDVIIRQREDGTEVVEFREGPTKTRSGGLTIRQEQHKQCSAPMAEKAIQCGYSSFGFPSDPKE